MKNELKISKFDNSSFGSINTITSPTGTIMFLGKEISNMWGHSNLTQAIKASKLNESEYKVIDLKRFSDFKKQLTNFKLVGGRASSITLLTESGMYKLALSSNLEKARPFRDWITSEVLPSIRNKGYYSFANNTEKIFIHTNISIQKQNSRDINQKNLIEKGLHEVIEYNRVSCLLHTGKTPSQLKKIGKNMGLDSKKTNSGKEVLRNTNPAIACAMSFTDDMVKKGFDLKTVSELSLQCAVPLFNGMIELGILPNELKKE